MKVSVRKRIRLAESITVTCWNIGTSEQRGVTALHGPSDLASSSMKAELDMLYFLSTRNHGTNPLVKKMLNDCSFPLNETFSSCEKGMTFWHSGEIFV